jgi:Ca-activated chloride channel family protein
MRKPQPEEIGMSSPLRITAAYVFTAAIIFTACSVKQSRPGSDQDALELKPPPVTMKVADVDKAETLEAPVTAAAQPRSNREYETKSKAYRPGTPPPAPVASRRVAKEIFNNAAPAMQYSMAMDASIGAAAGGLGKGAAAPSHRMKKYEKDDEFLAGGGWADGESNTEEYARIYENPFLETRNNPLSTFSIDVDAASYANARRFITQNRLPPADAVRIEEFINYFDYDYPQPEGDAPFSITGELATTPWNTKTRLVHIGLQGVQVEPSKLPPTSLTFLIDVSGSMDSPEKLPLLKRAFRMLVEQLRPQDRIAMVVYAGAAGVVLPPTSGNDKGAILEALDRLQAGGSTAGGEGLVLAYKTAQQGFLKHGNNRIILATDGDFNVGVSSDAEMVRLIEEKRKGGVFLSVLGFGTGNYKDSKMEQIADKGNGNYNYIDNIAEARKVLVEEVGGTLLTIAKDVKLQIEFNPAKVGSYRLIGYENRVLRSEDFNDDTKDAGELGAGHSVTALYEIAAPGVDMSVSKVDPLKYQKQPKATKDSWIKNESEIGNVGEEILTVKFRYKDPNGSKSKLITRLLKDHDTSWENASDNFRFSAAAAGFGLLLRDSQYKGSLDYDRVIAMAKGAQGRDPEGHRAEFIHLAEAAKLLAANTQVGSRQPAVEE